MNRTSQLPPISKSELRILDQEHSKIRRAYIELDQSILHAHGSPAILEIAQRLVDVLLLHLVHEEQFMEKVCPAVLLDQNQNGNTVLPELRVIQGGLFRRDVHAALQLRGVCKRWMANHLHVETLECETMEESTEEYSGESQPEVLRGAEESLFTWYPQVDPCASAYPVRCDESKVTS